MKRKLLYYLTIIAFIGGFAYDLSNISADQVAVAGPVRNTGAVHVKRVGVNKPAPVSRGQANKRVYYLTTTGYTYTGNLTATETVPGRGTIAADPRYFRFGTKLWVEGYGYGKVLDSGNKIKGNTPWPKGSGLANLDLFYETEKEALKWGRKVVKVVEYIE